MDIRPSDQLLCDDCWLGTLQQEGVLVDYLCNTDFEDGTNDLRDTETLKPAEGKADSNKVTIDSEIDGGSCSTNSLNMNHNDEVSQNKIEDYVSGTSLGRDTFTSDAFSETSEHEPAQIYQSRSGCYIMDSYLKTAQISRSILILIILFDISFLLQNLENKDVNLKATYQSFMIL